MFIKEEKDLLFLSLNHIIKEYELWKNLETNDKYHFLNAYKKLSKNDNSQFNISNKLLDILKLILSLLFFTISYFLYYIIRFLIDGIFLIKIV